MVKRPLMPAALDDLPACTACGHCCHLLVELAPLTDDVPEEFVVEHAGRRCLEQRGDGSCIALDRVSKLCTIYERRPQVCRDFNRGESLCRRVVLGGGKLGLERPGTLPIGDGLAAALS